MMGVHETESPYMTSGRAAYVIMELTKDKLI